jgi:ribosomal protein S18 acetylase RimI-like enzyme
MAVFEAEARKCGVQALHLGVTNSNSVAIKTYTRAGFSDHEGRRIMTKRL